MDGSVFSRRNGWSARWLVTLLAVLSTGMLAAQVPVPGQPRPRVNVSPRPETTASPREVAPGFDELDRVTIDFPGGSPAALVETIRAATDQPVNIILDDGADAIVLPPVTATDLPYGRIFQYLGERDEVRTTIDGYPVSGSVGFVFRSEEGMWRMIMTKVESHMHPPRVEVHSLRELIDDYPAAVIMRAIELAWSHADPLYDPRLSPYLEFVPMADSSLEYHADTALLMVKAGNRDMEIANQVLDRVGQQVRDTTPDEASADWNNDDDADDD